jgi:hypothetical protein
MGASGASNTGLLKNTAGLYVHILWVCMFCILLGVGIFTYCWAVCFQILQGCIFQYCWAVCFKYY